MPKISVVIATYNRCRSLKDTLDSLLNQEYDGSFDYEVIVADNNSNDETKETVESYKAQFNGKLKYLFEPRQGKPYALNLGITEAKGEIIAFTDDDCRVDRRWVSEINKTFKKNNVGIAGGIINPIWLSKKPRWWNDKFYGALAIRNYGGLSFITSLRSTNLKLPYGANYSFKKHLFYEYGMFNEKMMFAQDTEICSRFLKKGVRIMYSPSVMVHHKINPSRLRKNHFYKWFYRRGVLNKHIQYYKRKFYHLFGIPLWMFLGFMREIGKSLNPFISAPERLYHRCLSFRQLGMMSTKFKDSFYGKEN